MDETGFCGMNFFNTRQYCDSVRDVNFYLRKLHFLWIYHAEKFEASGLCVQPQKWGRFASSTIE